MHIVLVSREYIPSYRGGGIASYIKEMADIYVQLGHYVTVICASDDTRVESDTVQNRIRIIRLPKGDFIIPSVEGNSKIKKLRCIYRFYSYRRKIRDTILNLQNVDVVEVPEYGAEGFYLDDLPFPVVTRLHTPAFLDRKDFAKKKYSILQFYDYWCACKEERTLKKAKYITSCSNCLRDWVCQYFKIDKRVVKVIYNPINTENWKIDLPILSSQSGNINILFVGTVAKEKGIRDLIEACQILRNKGIQLKLTIAGKLGQFGMDLKTIMRNEAWCVFLGNIPRNQLKILYYNNEIACFPSWWEAFGLICIEAMLASSLVIGSTEGGMNEIIEDGIDGFLLAPKNPQLWAQKIMEVHQLSAMKKNHIRQNAQLKVIYKFDSSIIAAQMLDYYQYLIDKSRL